jgi:predicted lipid carrier protein YhbT
MATADECKAALESLTARIADMEARDRQRHLLDRTMSLRVPDLDVTFVTRLGPDGAEPVRLADDTAQAQVRFTADSDVVVALGADPGLFLREWLSGKLKVHASFLDMLHLRKLL